MHTVPTRPRPSNSRHRNTQPADPTANYPGLLALPDQELIDLVADPLTGLHGDAGDVIAAAVAILADRLDAAA